MQISLFCKHISVAYVNKYTHESTTSVRDTDTHTHTHSHCLPNKTSAFAVSNRVQHNARGWFVKKGHSRLDDMPQQDDHQRNRDGPHQVLVVGVLHVGPRAGRNVRPGGVRRQPHGRRPERRRHRLEDVHGVLLLAAGVLCVCVG